MTHRSKTSSGGSAHREGGRRASAATLAGACALLLLAFGATSASAAPPTFAKPVVSEVKGGSVHLSALVDPQESRVYPSFEYSTDQVNWATVGADPYAHVVEPNSGPQTLDQTLSGLKGDTTYYVRTGYQIEPEYVPRSTEPPNPTFTTPHVNPPKAVKIGSATEVGFFEAKFSAEVERPGDAESAADVQCRLEYVSNAEYSPRNEIQKIYVRGRAGTYKLSFEGQTTKPILFNAAPALVAERLEELSSIGPGDVAVSGGPGDLNGTKPYEVEFKGALGFQDVEQMTGDGGGLVSKTGSGEAPVETAAPGHGEEKFTKASRQVCNPEAATAPGKSTLEIQLSKLSPGTTYHVRLVAENAGGTDYLVGENFTTVFAPPPTVTMLPVENPGPTSVEANAIINPNGTRTLAWFEYSADKGETWRFAPYGDYGEIPAPIWCEVYGGDDSCSQPLFGTTPLPFHRTINERNINHFFGPDILPLEPNTSYIVRIHAQNPGGTSVSPSLNFKTKNVPPIVQTLNGNGGTEEAKLSGRVNPKNAPVTYQFEWGVKEGEEDETYENLDPDPAEGLTLADNSLHLVSTAITGLQPGTAYHFRIVAENIQTHEVTRGSDRTFVTGQAPPEPASCPNESSRVGPSANLPDCRVYEFVTPKMNQGELYLQAGNPLGGAVAPDGNRIIVNPIDAPEKALGSHLFESVLAQRGPAGNWLQAESLSPPNLQPVGEYAGPAHNTVSSSSDLHESIVITDQPIAGPGSPQGPAFYLRRADGSFVPIAKVGGGLFNYWQILATSQDYKRIFFEPSIPQEKDDPFPGYPFGGNSYEWHEGNVALVGILPPTEQELEEEKNEGKPAHGKPAPSGGHVAQPMNGKGLAMTPDGKSVLFVENETGRLYLRINGEESVFVSKSHRSTPDPDPIANPRPGVVSEDGKAVLFTSRSELTDDAYTGVIDGVRNQAENLYEFNVKTKELTDLTVDHKPEDASRGAGVREILYATPDLSYIYLVATGNLAPGATSGEQNIYVLHDGKFTYVAGDPVGVPESGYPVDMSADGTQFIFNSATNATSYDSAGHTMVYRYTYGEGVDCISCRPSGVKPAADASTAYNNTLMTDDGSRIFFVSADEIVPQATNGLQNAYEYEHGELHLLTPGDSEVEIGLLGASASGNDVFLITTEELAKGEGGAWAAYDAHVDGVVPQEETGQGCQGESCRGPRTEPPVVTSPGSASFEAINRVAASAPKSVRGAKVDVRVIAPGTGTIDISGRGLKPTTLSAAKAGSVTVSLALKKSADGRRRRTGSYRTQGEVLFTAANGDVSRADVSLKFEGATKKQRRGGR